MSDLHVVQIPTNDVRLGRQVVHDPESRRFAFPRQTVVRQDIQHRVYQPLPNPNQVIGCCTGVDAVIKLNTAGSRIVGSLVLGMPTAVAIYSQASKLDPWKGFYPPDDTGSSGLAACKAQVALGYIDRYEWIFTGVDGILAALEKKAVGVGTFWLRNMFNVDPTSGLIDVSGPQDGGHQWTITGYSKKHKAFRARCWWGTWGLNKTGQFLIRETDLATLLAQDGDAHMTYMKGSPT